MSHADLIERLEKAESGSRELDDAVWWPIASRGPHYRDANGRRERNVMAGFGQEDWRSMGPYDLPPAYTTSIDAIVALIGEKLPGWTTDVHTADASPCTYPVHWRVTSLHFDDCQAGIYYQHPKLEERELGEAYGQTPALALCIALLRALDQNGGEHVG